MPPPVAFSPAVGGRVDVARVLRIGGDVMIPQELFATVPRTHGLNWNLQILHFAVNSLVYFSTMLGTVYVINASAEQLDAAALVAVNDLGQAGHTWSLSSLSYADGRLYHRGLKRLICIKDSP